MKLLFDQNLSFKLCDVLADLFPGSSHVRHQGLDRADDQIVWSRARSDGYVLVTHDADFAEMATFAGPPPKVVWLRCGNQTTAFIAGLMRRHADAIIAFGANTEAACLELY
jgi:predicted nuclease of predicted toxin-antitoxin system